MRDVGFGKIFIKVGLLPDSHYYGYMTTWVGRWCNNIIGWFYGTLYHSYIAYDRFYKVKNPYVGEDIHIYLREHGVRCSLIQFIAMESRIYFKSHYDLVTAKLICNEYFTSLDERQDRIDCNAIQVKKLIKETADLLDILTEDC